ncbi:lipopolysaccharide-induced tumor necrosis factor-alpha factor homolog isoform X2 [Hyla sarda]|uniref:lipopolysaccharide-induced tumor necrosis factor-alpha factor homolog isoform X2 n=1 Tax=Hyla sarda TaxID=327740 RepID=UPI0024C362B4|nr:lipopolysaccharide-induced tumor necrosis factor-alpha factor homolog isoform X2 [Hyla sarda]
MFDKKIPSTANMDDEPPAYQPPAITPYLSTPQYCLQPVPTMTHPQAISHIVTPCQPKVIYHQPVPVCIVETGTHPIGRCLVDSPSPATCPSCHENVVTRVTFHSGLLTWLLCVAIMFLGLVAGCCLIPFCMNATKDVDHFCPRCECHLFKYKRL